MTAELLPELGRATLQLLHQNTIGQALPEANHQLIRTILGPDHPDTRTTKANLAGSYRHTGHTNGTISVMSEVLAEGDDVFGPDHPTLLAMRRDFDEWSSTDDTWRTT